MLKSLKAQSFSDLWLLKSCMQVSRLFKSSSGSALQLWRSWGQVGLFPGLVTAGTHNGLAFLQLRTLCFSLQSQAEVICCDVGSALQVITPAPVSASPDWERVEPQQLAMPIWGVCECPSVKSSVWLLQLSVLCSAMWCWHSAGAQHIC